MLRYISYITTVLRFLNYKWMLHFKITFLMSLFLFNRNIAMVHTVVHTHQELKLFMLRMGRRMLYPTGTHMQVSHGTLPFLVSLHLGGRSIKTEGFLFLSLRISKLYFLIIDHKSLCYYAFCFFLSIMYFHTALQS